MERIREFFGPRFVRWSLALAIATTGVCWWGDQNGIVVYGTLLQLIAILLVFLEVQSSVEVLSPGRLKADIANWWTAVKMAGRLPPIVGKMNARESGLDTAQIIARTGTLTPTQTVEERVEALERRMAATEAWVGRVQSTVEREARERAAALEKERQARAEAIGGLRQDVVNASVAEPWKTIFGIVCLAVGVALSGFAPVVVAAVEWLRRG